MGEIGNRSVDVLVNCRPLQESWCKENGVRVDFEDKPWMYQVLRSQIASFKPDVLLFYAGALQLVRRTIREELRANFPWLRIVTGFWGDELLGNQYERAFGDLDLAFTITTAYREYFDLARIPAHVIGNCYEDRLGERVLRMPISGPSFDFTFAGTTGYGYPDHRQRYLDLIQIMTNTTLNVWCDEPYLHSSVRTSTRRLAKRTLAGLLSRMSKEQLNLMGRRLKRNARLANLIDLAAGMKSGFPSSDEAFFIGRPRIADLFPDRAHPLLQASEYYDLVRRSRVVLNRHRDEHAEYGNIRVFEVTGLGSCLLTDRGKELGEFFDTDAEMVTYESPDECVEKVRYLLDHEEERRAIAAAGQQRTLSEHTVVHRCRKIDEILQQALRAS